MDRRHQSSVRLLARDAPIACVRDRLGFFDTVRLLHKGRFQMCDGVQIRSASRTCFGGRLPIPGQCS